jgi:hypothetical protein
MPIYVQYVHIVEAACWGVEAFGLDSVQIMSIFFLEKQVLRRQGVRVMKYARYVRAQKEGWEWESRGAACFCLP